MASHI